MKKRRKTVILSGAKDLGSRFFALRAQNDIKIKAIIFDLGNVILNYDAVKAARQFSRACQVPIGRVWLHFFTSRTEKAYTRGEISSYAFYRHACKALQTPVTYKVFRRYWNEIFSENKGMDALLRRLKKHYPLYLVSNTNEMHFDHIQKRFKILKHFRRVFPSHVMGHRKPDREIYEKVLQKIKLRPEETVFIDDVPRFVRGAHAVGMHAIRFRNKVQLTRDLRRLRVKISRTC